MASSRVKTQSYGLTAVASEPILNRTCVWTVTRWIRTVHHNHLALIEFQNCADWKYLKWLSSFRDWRRRTESTQPKHLVFACLLCKLDANSKQTRCTTWNFQSVLIRFESFEYGTDCRRTTDSLPNNPIQTIQFEQSNSLIQADSMRFASKQRFNTAFTRRRQTNVKQMKESRFPLNLGKSERKWLSERSHQWSRQWSQLADNERSIHNGKQCPMHKATKLADLSLGASCFSVRVSTCFARSWLL